MLQNIIDFFRSIIDNDYLISMLLAVLPMIEVRGAVPISVGMNMNKVLAVLLPAVSSTLAVVPNMIFVKPFLNKLKSSKWFKHIASNVENDMAIKSKKIENKINKSKYANLRKYLAVVLFVGLPLPFTGGYTGSTLAVFMDLDPVKSEIAVLVGNLLASIIMLILSTYFKEQLDIIILILTILFVLSIIVYVYRLVFKRKIKIQKSK